uniref:Light receptive cryptochrome n=1 Tax=Platynereis dumerilii TaxID=6359 RepID=UPI00220F120B
MKEKMSAWEVGNGIMEEKTDDWDNKEDNGKEHVSLHWFRHGLRLHDNPALLKSLEGAKEFYALFIWDGEVAGTKLVSYPRMKFLLECLKDLDDSLKKHGGRLYVVKGPSDVVIKQLIEEWGVTRVTCEIDPEPIWQPRDKAVKDLCATKGVKWFDYNSHLLWDPKAVCDANGGRPPHTYKLFCQVTDLLGKPETPHPDPDFSHVQMPVSDDFDDKFGLPTLKELGCEPECEEQEKPFNKWQGGETGALELLETRLMIERTAYKAGYIMPNQYIPDLVGPPRSMSPHLRFGALSIRKFYWDLHNNYAEVCGGEWLGALTAQLVWREYFYCMSYGNPSFDKMEGNPICLQIPWYKDEEALEKWKQGQTGFPWIDACMRQLRYEGWMHHVGRHAVACFLTRGDLWISWVDGLEAFYKYMLDGDWSVCAGNWMWVSSSAFENCLQCPQCFSPVLYGMRMDPTGEFTRRYVPQLKNMPLKYLFQPWKAPKEVQEKAGCVIGEDYPSPMVDHKEASSKCRRMMEDVKSIIKDPEVWHCTPSDTNEVRKFCWLPEHMTADQPCLGDLPCIKY